MAIRAFHEVDIVAAGLAEERGVHRFHIAAAIGKFRMAIGAGGPCGLLVLVVTGKAGQALVYAHGRPVIARAYLRVAERGVALIAQRLPPIGTHPQCTLTIVDLRQRQH